MGEDVQIVLRTEAQGNGAQATEEGLNRVTSAGQRAAETVQKATSATPKAPRRKHGPEFDPDRPAPKIIDTWVLKPASGATQNATSGKTFSREQVERSQQWNRERAQREADAIADSQQKKDASRDPSSPLTRARQIDRAKTATL